MQVVVAIVLWRRKIHKQFPVFFAFLVTQVLIFAITYPVYTFYGINDKRYFWLYWLAQVVNAVLGFKVIHEIFLDVFRPYHALKDLGTPVFKWAGAGDAAGIGGGGGFELLQPGSNCPCRDDFGTFRPTGAVRLDSFLDSVFAVSGSFAQANQFWDRAGLWTFCWS